MGVDKQIVIRAKGSLSIIQERQGEIGLIGDTIANEAIDVSIWGDTEEEVKQKLKKALSNFAINWLRGTEIHRVYSTRYDCLTVPEGVRRVA